MNENLTVKSEHLDFNLITFMKNLFHHMFPRFYGLRKEGNENCEISGD